VQHIELQDDSQVNLSPASLERARRETARVEALWSLRTPRRFTLPLAPPLEKLPAGGRFGSRRFFNGEPRSPHSGADYAAAQGTPVLAVAPGRVVLAADHFFSGKSVFVDHGDGLLSMSFHLSGLAVAEGDEVAAGEILGLVGATGRATGPHLHFGLRWRGARVDPADLLRAPEGLPALGP
jgi:murein DD-endopeptidase MepM/ murein hydrolase activator NlpD